MTIPVTPEALQGVNALDELNSMLTPLSFRAGWNKQEPSLWPRPKENFVPAHWSWSQARAGLDAAGRLISTEQAERRNLFMVNPIGNNYYATLRTLVSAYQMILPGEKARSHRHTPNALRLVLDVPDTAYTVVDGVRIDMRPNDVLLTPGWSWHGHGNEGDRPGYWIDFLDVPLVHLLEPMFLEHWPEGFQKPMQATRDSSFVFAWTEIEPRLKSANPDERGRVRIELGSPALPTIALYMESLCAGRAPSALRTTENQIYAVVAGAGESAVGGSKIKWSKGDVFTIPSWREFQHRAHEDAVLFCVSDFPVMSKLGFFHVEPST